MQQEMHILMNQPEMECGDVVVFRAQIDPKVTFYWLILQTAVLVASLIGIAIYPFYLIIFFLAAPQYTKKIQVILTTKYVIIRRGFLAREEIMIPLEKIQDISVKQNIFSRMVGIFSIDIQTAGNNAPGGVAEGHVDGVIESKDFRDRVFAQRDILLGKSPASSPNPASYSTMVSLPSSRDGQILVEIRDILIRIEHSMNQKK